MCGLGGHCVDCDSCPRTICGECLEFSVPEILNDDSALFLCPFCHTNSPRRKECYFVSERLKYEHIQSRSASVQPFRRGKIPIKSVVGFIKTPSTRGTFPRINCQGLAIINFRLSSIDKRGDPYQAVVNYLEAYFSSTAKDRGLSTLNIDFNIDPTNIQSLERHRQIVNGFVQQMCQCVQH
jgi:hypothetical protein